MAQSLPPPSTIRKAIIASLWFAAFGIAMMFSAEMRVPGAVLAIVFAGLAALGFRNLNRATKPPIVIPSPPSAADDARMFAVLDSLGVPLMGDVGDPQSAFTGGATKAAIYRGHELLVAGKSAEAIKALRSALAMAGDGNPRARAAAHYLIGKAHEADGHRDEAMAEFNECLRLAPDYLHAQSGLRSLRTDH